MIQREKISAFCAQIIDWLMVAVIFLTPLYFAYFQENFNIFELNKLLIIRLGVSLMFFFLLVKISLGGEFFYSRKLVWLLVGLVLAVYVGGAIFSVRPQLSWWGNYDRQQGIYSLLYYWLFFVIVLLQVRRWQQVKNLLRAVLAAAAVVVAYGLAQKLGLDPLKWQGGETRIFSSLGQPNFLGHYLVLVIPLTVYYLTALAKHWYSRLAVGAIVGGELACLLFTLSRGAWLALAASTLGALIIWLIIAKRKKLPLIFLSGMVAIFLVLAGSICFYNQGRLPINNHYFIRLASAFNPESATNKIRWLYWSIVPEHFTQSPWPRWLVGFGKDSQTDIFVKYYRPEWSIYEVLNSFPDRVHNSVLDVWLEFGLLGLLIFGLFNFYLLWQGIKLARAPAPRPERFLAIFLMTALIAYWVAGWFGFPLTTHYLYYYLAAGLLLVMSGWSNERRLSLEKLSRPFRWSVVGLLILFSLFFLYFFTGRYFVADYFMMRAKKAEASGDCAAVIAAANQTLKYYPLSNYYKEQYIFMNTNCLPSLTQRNDLLAVSKNVLGPISTYDAPDNYYLLMNQAHFYGLLGYYLDKKYYTKAEENYLKLIVLNPYLTVNYQDYGRLKMWAQDYDGAIKIFQRLLAVIDSVDNFSSPTAREQYYQHNRKQLIYTWQLLGDCYRTKKDYDAAINYYLRVATAQPEYVMVNKDLAEVYYEQGDLARATIYYQKGAALDGANALWLARLAELNWQLGRRDIALKYAQEAIKISPENKEAKAILDKSVKIKNP